MRAGKLRQVVEIQSALKESDKKGAPRETFVTIRRCRAAIKYLRGQEIYGAQQVQAQSDVVFTTRYFTDINESHLVLYREKRYDMTRPPVVLGNNEGLELYAKLRGQTQS